MRKVFCFLLCLLLAAAPYASPGSEDPGVSELRRKAQADYTALSKEADALMKEAITVPVPPSTAISCADEEKAEADSRSLESFMDAFGAPERPLCTKMLDLQRQLQLMGAEPDYTREAALTDRLGQKALQMITDHGQDVEKVPAIAAAVMQVATDMQLLGLDMANRSTALMEKVGALYENAIDKLFRMLVEEHDYGTVKPILDAARASLLLSGSSKVDTEKILSRLQNALRFELTLHYDFEQTGNHRWVQEAVFNVMAEIDPSGAAKISGTGTGSLLSFVWDDAPEFTVTAPDFPVQARFEDFDPCAGSVTLLLTPLHPLSETAHVDGESIDWPLLKISWEVSFEDKLQEDGLYRFPLTLRNRDAAAVDETLENDVPENVVTLRMTLTHKPKS